jgi:hypothetical protein
MIRITILSLFLFFSSNRIFSQDFYINDNSEIQFLSYLISPEWSNLNLNESIEFLKNSGFKEVKSTNKYNLEVVSGKITNNNYVFYRELAFENKIIKSYSDVIVFFQPSYKYLASPLKDMGSSFENQYQDALKKDEKIKDLFLKYYSQSIKKDGITSQILGDITDIGFDFSNSISTPDFEILRNCKSRLEQNKIFNYYSSRQVLIKEKQYLVGDNDLRKINEYDLNKMVDVFLLDCKNNKIPFTKGKVLVSFEKLPAGLLGVSSGINDNSKIELKVDPEKWLEASLPKKWYLIYHELGHDVLNLNHGNGGKMMFNFSDKGYSWKEFWEDKSYMMNSIKK